VALTGFLPQPAIESAPALIYVCPTRRRLYLEWLSLRGQHHGNPTGTATPPLFSVLPDDTLNRLAQKAIPRTVRKNAVIVSKGDTNTSFYILLSGKARVYIDDDSGKEAVLNILQPGDCFGELALLGGIPRSANVIASQQSRLLMLHPETFQETLLTHPEAAMKIIKHLALRVAELSEEVGSLALLDVYGRLVRLIDKESVERDGQRVMERLTHQDLASRIGASRETVTRILRDLSKGDYLHIHGEEIVINRPLPRRW